MLGAFTVLFVKGGLEGGKKGSATSSGGTLECYGRG